MEAGAEPVRGGWWLVNARRGFLHKRPKKGRESIYKVIQYVSLAGLSNLLGAVVYGIREQERCSIAVKVNLFNHGFSIYLVEYRLSWRNG